VFLNSPRRETPKNVLKKKAKKSNILGLVGSSRANQKYVGVRHFVFLVPLACDVISFQCPRACLHAVYLTYAQRGNIARSALAAQGAAAEAAARFALLCQCSPPTYCDCHRAPALWPLPLPRAVHIPPAFRFRARRLCSRALGFPNRTAPNNRRPHFRSLSVPSATATALQSPVLPLSCLIHLYAPRAGRTLPAGEGGCAAGSLPAGEGGCAAGSLPPSHRPK
jgi:hypothetical protein